MNPEGSQTLSVFACAAREFCAWCEGGAATSNDVDDKAAQWLARLYSEAIALPRVGPENANGVPEIPQAEKTQAEQTLAGFRGYYYREFFDPDARLNEEPVVGDLGDDLMDTYLDIKAGLICFDRGETSNALWHWSFLHRVHWGRHAASALYALHCKSIAS